MPPGKDLNNLDDEVPMNDLPVSVCDLAWKAQGGVWDFPACFDKCLWRPPDPHVRRVAYGEISHKRAARRGETSRPAGRVNSLPPTLYSPAFRRAKSGSRRAGARFLQRGLRDLRSAE